MTGSETVFVDDQLPCGVTFHYRLRSYVNGVASTSGTPVAATTAGCGTRRVVYVAHNATGDGDGSSWSNAFSRLEAALATALRPGDEIWVAAGTYTPTAQSDREATFEVPGGVALYGGFAGDETSRAARDWRVNTTILSGDLLGNDGPGAPDLASISTSRADNSRHVVTFARGSTESVLDGFTVTGGNAVTETGGDIGGGIFVEHGAATLRNLIVRGNVGASGGGVATLAGSTLRLVEVALEQNFAYGQAGGGGGLFNSYSTAELINVRFLGNAATGRDVAGGGLLTEGGEMSLTNGVFSGNRASGSGGALAARNGSARLVHVTASGNSAQRGGAVAVEDAALIVRNSIIWGNAGDAVALTNGATADLSYSLFEGGTVGPGNRDADPLLRDLDGKDGVIGTSDDDLQLQPASPAVDSGDNAALPDDRADLDGDGDRGETLPQDASGGPRVVDDPAVPDTGAGEAPVADMGAYERPADPALPLLAINFAEGRPGSAFLITASGMGPGASWQVAVADRLLGTVQASQSGAITLLLRTELDTPSGAYQVTFTPRAPLGAAEGPVPSLAFTLNTLAPLRESPAGTADYEFTWTPAPQSPATHNLYLPVLRR